MSLVAAFATRLRTETDPRHRAKDAVDEYRLESTVGHSMSVENMAYNAELRNVTPAPRIDTRRCRLGYV